MARLPRVVIVDVPHHVTQRGNARQVILASDADRFTYLELLREYSQLYVLSVLGYCLMSNHVHLIAIPANSTGSLAISETGAWALRGLLERPAIVDRPRMAGAILFLSVG